MVNIVASPYPTDESGNPVSGCLSWQLQPDAADVVTSSGGAAEVTVVFPFSVTVPANGTPFKIWGYDFTIDDSTGYTATSFELDSNPLLSSGRFANMIRANIFFNRACDVSAYVDGGGFGIRILWRECKEQPRFGSASMDFANLTAAGLTCMATNGVSPVYVPGFKIVTRLLRTTGGGITWDEITRLEGLEPNRNCTGSDSINVDYMADAKRLLYPILPELSETSFVAYGGAEFYDRLNNTGILAALQLEYGHIYRQDCNPQSGTFQKSEIVYVANMAFPTSDIYNIRRYWPNHILGLPPGQTRPNFLSTRPTKSRVCVNSFLWLWLISNHVTETGIRPSEMRARFAVLGKNGITVEHDFTLPEPEDQVLNFNVSPGFLEAQFSVVIAGVQQYDVRVLGTLDGEPFNASQTLTFILDGECCDDRATDVYFLNPAGGIDTISVEITEIATQQDGTEIHVGVSCETDLVTASKYGGRTLSALRAYDRATITAKESFSEEIQNWFSDFKRSPHRWFRIDLPTGESIAKKFIPEPGSISIFRNGENLELTATGYFQDVPLQSTTEPI